MSGVKGRSGRLKKPPNARELLKTIIPIQDMFEPEEVKIYESLVDVYLKDFEDDDLKSGDIDDIMNLAMNKVLEFRLLKDAKNNKDSYDLAKPLETLKKQTDKLKDSLASRRKDRIDPNKYKGFSIVNLAVAFDEDKKNVLLDRVKENKDMEDRFLINREEEDYHGNRYDSDVSERDPEEDND